MIYLASPYSHPDEAVRKERAIAALRYTSAQMALGYLIFSPIVYGYQFHACDLTEGDHITWLAFNNYMINKSTEMHVLRLEGWKESAGIKDEWEFAERLGLRIRTVDPS